MTKNLMTSKIASSGISFRDLNIGIHSKRSLKVQANALPSAKIFHVFVKDESSLIPLLNDPDVLSVERNCQMRLWALPNDPDVAKNLGLLFIRAPEAWNISSSSRVVVAISDTGVDIHHPDLQNNLWKNAREASGLVGVDDDGNGYVDDIDGWATPENSNDPTPGIYAESNHGTHVAGIVGAVGNNNLGSTGVAWAAQLMPIRTFKKSSYTATSSDLIESIYYAVNNGAELINLSWGQVKDPTPAELDAFAYAQTHDVFVVAAAGNDGHDMAEVSPASISTVFAVGSINSQRLLSTFSNYGQGIGALAPGGDSVIFGAGLDEAIYSTLPGGSFGFKKGTSMSAPFVTGVAALVKSLLPQIKPAEMKRLLQEGSDRVTIPLFSSTTTYPVLNAAKVMALAQEISRTNATCTENCLQSGVSELASLPPVEVVKFGGGCAPLRLKSSGGPLSASFDITHFLMIILSIYFLSRRKIK